MSNSGAVRVMAQSSSLPLVLQAQSSNTERGHTVYTNYTGPQNLTLSIAVPLSDKTTYYSDSEKGYCTFAQFEEWAKSTVKNQEIVRVYEPRFNWDRRCFLNGIPISRTANELVRNFNLSLILVSHQNNIVVPAYQQINNAFYDNWVKDKFQYDEGEPNLWNGLELPSSLLQQRIDEENRLARNIQDVLEKKAQEIKDITSNEELWENLTNQPGLFNGNLTGGL